MATDHRSEGLPNGAAARLCAAYGFGEAAVGERLSGGYANDMFRVVADGMPFVLRIKHPPVMRDDIAWEVALTRLLSKRLPEVAAPVATPDGGAMVNIGDRVGWLIPFVDGRPADATREAHRVAAAAGLGRLHRAGQELALPRRPRLRPLPELAWPPMIVPDALAEWSATIAEERERAIASVAAVAGSRRPSTSLVHGDYFPGNVLIADDALVGIVDWEEAQVDWLVWDLASAIGAFCSADADLDDHAARRFLDAYRDAGGPAATDDDDLLIPLLRVKRILEVLRARTDRDPRWDHQRRNLRSLEKLAHRTF